MSHRKFEAPRHGSLGFLPRKRTRKHRGKIRSFPKDDRTAKPHLTAFLGYKAGMTHVLRHVKRPGSKLHGMEAVEAVTILEVPPMVVIGLVGYVATPQGLRTLTTVWASSLSDEVRRNFYKSWYKAKRKAFTKHAKRVSEDPKITSDELERMKSHCSVIRVLAHTQMSLLNLRRKKAHLLEIQINGGDVAAKVDYGYSLFEQHVPIDTVFGEAERVDTIGVTKGHGFEGVVTRWGVKRLPRKSHRGLRKVACIGAWHPARVNYTVARAGQNGYHHRTERNKAVYRLGKKVGEGEVDKTASTEADLTVKGINPLGGWVHYGMIKNDWIMLKGSVVGTRKRAITLRKPIDADSKRAEDPGLKFINTSSTFGHGRFQTAAEKAKHYGK